MATLLKLEAVEVKKGNVYYLKPDQDNLEVSTLGGSQFAPHLEANPQELLAKLEEANAERSKADTKYWNQYGEVEKLKKQIVQLGATPTTEKNEAVDLI
jgi:hypothetical protein